MRVCRHRFANVFPSFPKQVSRWSGTDGLSLSAG